MKQRMAKAGVLLFILMIFFTVISRAAYNLSIAEVSVEKPEPQTFSPEVSAQGTVAGSREMAVSAVENLRVGAVYVVPGQAVEEGEILFEVDLQDLAEKMREKQLELQSLDLQIQSAAESAALAEESRNLNRAQVQEDYDRTAARENEAVAQALEELRKAQEEYWNFVDGSGAEQANFCKIDAELLGAEQMESNELDLDQPETGSVAPGQQEFDQTEESLRIAVEEKQAAYDQALKTRDESLYQAKKSVDTANLGTPKDYSVEQSQMTRGQKEAELAKLQALWDAHGKVVAPVRGMVTETAVRVGGTTTGGGDILLSAASEGASLSVTFPEELRAYVREGQQAVVTEITAAGSSSFSDQPVSERVTIRTVAGHSTQNGVSATETDEAPGSPSASGELSDGISGSISGGTGGGFTVTVDLPADRFAIGETVKLEVEARVNHYETCVPIGALHLSGEHRYYVNVAEKQSTILGEEWVVRRADVELLEKDGKYAAVDGISSEQTVVTESSRTLEEGSRVKMIHETD